MGVYIGSMGGNVKPVSKSKGTSIIPNTLI